MPAEHWTGTDSFTLYVTDQIDSSFIETVTIEVTNSPPFAPGATYYTPHDPDFPVTDTVYMSDTDSDESETTMSIPATWVHPGSWDYRDSGVGPNHHLAY